jgi:hypothetical protein
MARFGTANPVLETVIVNRRLDRIVARFRPKGKPDYIKKAHSFNNLSEFSAQRPGRPPSKLRDPQTGRGSNPQPLGPSSL